MLLIQISFLGCPAVGDGEIAENVVEMYRRRNRSLFGFELTLAHAASLLS